MQSPVEPVAAPISREHAAGSIRTVRGGGKADDQVGRLGISKGGHWPSPIFLIGKRSPLFEGDPFSPFDKPGAQSTAYNLVVECLKVERRIQW